VPGEFEALFRTAEPMEAIRARIAAALGSAGLTARLAIAQFPRDGQTAEALIGKAGAELSGGAASDAGPVIADRAMVQLYALVDRVAAGEISILLLGETGVGKEVLAERVHRASRRASGPLVRINCAALSDSLLESELFGHEKGAFTGALKAKVGLLESANGGTVFLDEVGDLPSSIQVKLLRVIERREVMRVGEVRPRPLDVRFVSATHRDLEAEVARGTFRQDLYFRLNGFSLVIPPLRERVAEIRPLAESLASQYAKAAGRTKPPKLSSGALELLERCAWPGNIRELRNVMERAVLLCSGDAILPEHLPVEKLIAEGPASASARNSESVSDSEQRKIQAALDTCAGNQTQAAKALGISRRTLLNRLDAMAVARPRKGRS
jgi:transcriptional regulator with PAS, ATPase and Fis domain